MAASAKILLIEDDSSIASSLERVLGAENYKVELEKRGDAGLERARAGRYDLVLTDLKLPGLSGLDLVRELHSGQPHLPIILMTAHGTTETAIEATKQGAYDYLVKPFDMPELIEVIGQALTSRRLMSEAVRLGVSDDLERAAIIGQSKVMQAIYKEIGRVASKPVTVLIRGETGTGKELIARALYQHSDRTEGPFVAINCAAIPDTLLESELFGHERGAFTGAQTRRIGRFEQANRGTIFLDEIGELTPAIQVKLLRVLQEKTVQRLGGHETIPVDVRVVAATNRDLESAIQQKQFREDLYYRLSVVSIFLPPLRERREDIPEIVRFFLRKFGSEMGAPNPSIHPQAMACLQEQPWPGNVRELENVIRKALLLARGFPIGLDHVRAAVLRTAPIALPRPQLPLSEIISELLAAAQRGELDSAHSRAMDAVERELFQQAIQLARGNQAKAARWLGISRLTMREKLLQFGLHPNQEESAG